MHTAYVSTTKLLRMAQDISGGNIAEAVEHLGHMKTEYTNAGSAIGVLNMKVKKHPGAVSFDVARDGFVVVS